MRADRLIAMLALLQVRGRMTARELAAELEVSTRTIYRDLDALSAAGVPVYTELGRNGGCALLEGYNSGLARLTEPEVQALLMLSIPAPLTELGVGQELRTALIKLATFLPTERTEAQHQVRDRIHLDSSPWHQPAEPVPHLRTIQQAVWQDRKLELTYQLPFKAEVQRVVEPYGLVAKTNVWHLVLASDGELRVLRVTDVVAAHLSEECFQRRPGFDLQAYWTAWCTVRERNQPSYTIRARISPALLDLIQLLDADSLVEVEEPDGTCRSDGWARVRLQFDSFIDARKRTLGMGGAIEVLEPRALRASVIDFATQAVELYASRP